MTSNKPTLSIGLPVFNGERYLKEALDSILAQTFDDFEVVISDNASTDSTQKICREYEAKDSRVHYYRNGVNFGVSKNYNRVFELSSGEYFKWTNYDDLYAPEYLQKCISLLDKDKSVVLCHSKAYRIDEYGKVVGNYDHRTLPKTASFEPHERFADLISLRNPCWAVLGVGRADSLRKTPLLGSYIGADRNLIAEIGLIGRIVEIEDHLFFRRDHPQAYTRKFCENKLAINTDRYAEQLYYWRQRDWINFPNWKDCEEFFKSVNRVPLKLSERLLCYDEIFRWFIAEGWLYLSGDIENLFLSRSRLGRKLVPQIKLNLGRTVIPILKRFR